MHIFRDVCARKIGGVIPVTTSFLFCSLASLRMQFFLLLCSGVRWCYADHNMHIFLKMFVFGKSVELYRSQYSFFTLLPPWFKRFDTVSHGYILFLLVSGEGA
ncbi:hypothetical protein PYW07_015334 [Mythimna separata]|uniref:Uncharacterized protein n=1 Tax=Mythimna separata TaxID=271217 RepID=A0AAD8DYD0_MYTSE|nr:hypothetical protein PYW07_015334 [Mythimna separata]